MINTCFEKAIKIGFFVIVSKELLLFVKKAKLLFF